MERTKPLDFLLPRLRQQVLATTLLNPERRWYLRELASKVGATPSSVQKELQNLVSAEILRRTDSGNRAYFQADPSSPFFSELQSLMKKSLGAVDIVRDALAPLASDIDMAFIYGSFAGSTPIRNTSDIDLMVVGQVDVLNLSDALLPVEAKIGREVNPTVYTLPEFTEKLRTGNHFLSTVARSEKLPIIGDIDVLATASH